MTKAMHVRIRFSAVAVLIGWCLHIMGHPRLKHFQVILEIGYGTLYLRDAQYSLINSINMQDVFRRFLGRGQLFHSKRNVGPGIKSLKQISTRISIEKYE
jgi:hypothetical protein